MLFDDFCANRAKAKDLGLESNGRHVSDTEGPLLGISEAGREDFPDIVLFLAH